MHINVPFPGIGNNLKWNIPVELESGVAVPPPNFGEGSDYMHHTNDQLLVLDLPPYVSQKSITRTLLILHCTYRAYFTGESHDWDGDEKS